MICPDCNEEAKLEAENTEGEKICNSCDENYVEDELTGSIIHIDDSVEAIDIGRFCRTVHIMTHCHNTELVHGEYYTSKAAEELFTECCRCDYPMDRDHALYTEDGDPYCEDCFPSECDYYNARNPIRPDETTYNECTSYRSYGVELEYTRAYECSLDNYYNSVRFGSKEDCSIRCPDGQGAEFDSPILYGDKGLNAIDAFCKSAASAEPNDSCGFHLHIGIGDMTETQRKNLVKAIENIQDLALLMVPRYRARNSYCSHKVRYDDRADFADLARDCERYSAFNLSAWYDHNTLEIRFHESTNNAEEIKNWVKLWLAFVDYIANDGDPDYFEGTNQRIFNRLTLLANREVAEFYARRIEFFNPYSGITLDKVTPCEDMPGQQYLNFETAVA